MGPIGVFLRCTGRSDPAEALEAVRLLGLNTIQVSKLDDRFYTHEGAEDFRGLLSKAGISASAVVIVFDGESYRDVPAVLSTVGFRPSELVEKRLEYSLKCVDFARALGVDTVTLHMGFLPSHEADPAYQRLLASVREVAAYGAERGVTLSLETGQETGDELARFLDKIPEHRVGVNFDFANLVLYGLDDSPAALLRLLDRVTSVHVKDGLPPAKPDALGIEVRLGEGAAKVRECLEILHQDGFEGPLVIENYTWRQLGTEPVEELRRAKEFIQQAVADIEAKAR